MPIISPSILTADLSNLSPTIEMINNSDAGFVHIDVMDGVFVPNITFGIPIVKAVKKISKKPLDVHLMIVNPERHFEAFAQAGADILTIHYEVCQHLHRSVQQIRELGMKPGVVLNPHTPVHLLEDILPYVDMVLLMTVNPGFGGQKFIESSYGKIKQLRKMIDVRGLSTLIEVDGGVNTINARLLAEAGVDVIVAGNAVISSPDPIETIRQLSNCDK
ncbi:MAG TPA: ribulose-phosphate 3-epimerase [Bacteroidales bacterium]|nr:ribulose-phosphate 3-epimerase [Bacteroidales bacterium]